MSVKSRGIGKCVGSAVWLALLSLLSLANSATAEPPANLLARPGFEAAEAALKTAWYPFEAGGYVNYEGSSEAYEIPARVIDMRRRLPGLLEKTATLEGLVNEAESKGLDASLLRVSLSVAKVFTPLLAEDASLEVADYPKDMIDFRILGREEALRRIESLALFEADQTEKVLDRAIEEAQAIVKNPGSPKKTQPQQSKPVTVENGAFMCDGKPIFLSGIYGLAVGGDQKRMGIDLAKDLGANLLGPLHISHGCTRGWDQFDDTYFEKHVFPFYRVAQSQGFWVSPALWNYHAPDWLAKIAPDINVQDEEKGWFRDALDLDHPLTSRFETMWFKYAASQLKKPANNFCYSLMGEEWCNPSFRGKYTEPRYQDWLKQKHGDIAALNKAWNTSYKDFPEAAGEESLKTKGGHYDWYRFNEDRLTAYNQAQIDGIQQSEPKGLWTCWPAAGCLVSAPVGGFDPQYGRNREDILRQSSVSGWDGGMFPYEAGRSTRQLSESHWAKYNLGWRDDMIYYDFAKSLGPEKPVFDPELHSLTSVYHIAPLGVSADYFRTCLWMEHLHGLGAHLFWWWGRKTDGTLHMSECLGGLLTQPQLLESWGRTVLELRRLTEYVALFPQLERKVRILYSEASAIQDPEGYPLQVRDAYEAVYFLDYPAGFITEKMIREGKLAECSLLIVPGAKYVGDDTVAKIHEYHKTGGRLVIVGKESLTCDEYGHQRDIAAVLRKPIQFGSTPEAYSPQLDYLTGSTPEEYAPQLDKALEEVGIRRPVRSRDTQGNVAWGVELRAASKDNRTIAYAINLNREPVEVVIQTKPGARRANDLITGQTVQTNRPLILMPRRPMLLEIGDAVPGDVVQ